MQRHKEKKCECGSYFTQYNSLRKYCSWACEKKYKPRPQISTKKYTIPKVSKKQAELNKIYSKLRIEFLSRPENQICFIEGCSKKANSIEHRAGRWGSNFLDTTTWAGCCIEHNLELEKNTELSKKYQLSKITGKPKN
ncbi:MULTISPECIES: hypothetical protein [Flavobacterium]|uniref:Uncharacterized protein n=1 Tax=Flavobacterium keumense TaxID=1306518 RepID=A0ABY8N299_9FLAO|nr:MULTISPECIES: hypothetical protein [Flavobacterium]WGK93770.1 hypothetical protein MG292_06615 [Flavobacterium keumense]